MKTLILSSILVVSLSADYFSKDQKEILNEAYNIGKQIKTADGLSFENTLRSVAFSESSGGVYIVGDEHITKDLAKASLGVYQVRVQTAREVIKKDKFMREYFSYLLIDEKALISMLLSKSKFGALVAGSYLKMRYNYALRKGIIKPWERAISNYNGGNNNTTYINKIRKNMKLIKRNI